MALPMLTKCFNVLWFMRIVLGITGHIADSKIRGGIRMNKW
jgi:hypothetical protein